MEDKCHRVLDYVAAQPNSSLILHKSGIFLTIDSDSAYLVEQQARSTVEGLFTKIETPNLLKFSMEQ